MLSWLCSVWNDFLLPENFLTNFFASVGIIISIISFISARKALASVEGFRKNQSEWNFYANLLDFFKRLKLTIGTDRENPSPFLSYFYSQNKDLESNDYDSHQVKMLRNLAEDFIHYLSTANEHIPLSMNQDDFNEWKNRREKLTDFLNSALYLGERLDYDEENFNNALTEIHDIINCMTAKAEKVIDKIAKENLVGVNHTLVKGVLRQWQHFLKFCKIQTAK